MKVPGEQKERRKQGCCRRLSCCCCCRAGYIFWALKDSESPEDFGNRPWKTPRCLSSIYFYTFCLLSSGLALGLTFSTSQELAKYFIYLTNWSLILAFANYLLIVAVILKQWREDKAALVGRRDLKWFEGVSWILNNCNILSVLVTAGFWVSVYPDISDTADQSLLGWTDRLLGHGLIPVLILLDVLLVNAKPYRRRHFYQPVLLGGVYAAFSYVYFYYGGRNYVKHGEEKYIYSFLDWGEPRPTLGNVGLLMMALGVVHFVVGWIDQRRKEEIRLRDAEVVEGNLNEIEPLQNV